VVLGLVLELALELALGATFRFLGDFSGLACFKGLFIPLAGVFIA
jgi:hypothetical protein